MTDGSQMEIVSLTIKKKHGSRIYRKLENDRSQLCNCEYINGVGEKLKGLMRLDFMNRMILGGMPRKKKKKMKARLERKSDV